MRPSASISFSTRPRRWNSASVRKRSRRRVRYLGADRQGLLISPATPHVIACSIMRESIATTRLAIAGRSLSAVLQIGNVCTAEG